MTVSEFPRGDNRPELVIKTGERLRVPVGNKRLTFELLKLGDPNQDICGGIVLTMLRQPTTGEEKGVTTPMGVEMTIADAEDVTDAVEEKGFELGTGTYILWGRRRSVANPKEEITHICLVVAGDTGVVVIDPLPTGSNNQIQTYNKYRGELSGIEAVYKVPMGPE